MEGVAMKKNNDVFVSKSTMMRLINDIKQITINPLDDNGIYYEHSESDMLFGKAMIVGPTETPYQYGYYFFELRFPAEYPHKPPEVKFCTRDGTTRFNPNLYRDGKVCISILNTWAGEKWSGCQTISSVLLTICSLLNNEPLLNEPGIYKDNGDFDSYNDIILYKNLDISIIDCLESAYIQKQFSEFIDKMRELFIKNKDEIMSKIKEYKKTKTVSIVSTKIYGMRVTINYPSLEKKMNKLIKKIEKKK